MKFYFSAEFNEPRYAAHSERRTRLKDKQALFIVEKVYTPSIDIH